MRRVLPLLFALTATVLVPVQASAANTAGWVRLAHLSPNTPPVDVYLSAYGNARTLILLKHVAYGGLSPYEKVPSGYYTVAMRKAGAKSGSPAVLSTNVQVDAGDAYTIAGLGPASGLHLQVLKDQLNAPTGKAAIRVIEASLRERSVNVSADGKPFTSGLKFANFTNYHTVATGNWPMLVKGMTEQTTRNLDLSAGTIHTVVVLDGSKGLKLIDLTDAAGSRTPPRGGAGTGLGGTAKDRTALPGAALLILGLGIAGTAGAFLRRAIVAHRA